MKEKPNITQIMMIALTRDFKWTYSTADGYSANASDEEHERFIVPLKNFSFLETDDLNTLTVPVPKEVKAKFKKYKRVTLSLTNDPRVTWASDWSDLGCFRLVYKLYNAKVEIKGNKLIVTSPRKEGDPGRDRDLTIPDRRI